MMYDFLNIYLFNIPNYLFKEIWVIILVITPSNQFSIALRYWDLVYSCVVCLCRYLLLLIFPQTVAKWWSPAAGVAGSPAVDHVLIAFAHYMSCNKNYFQCTWSVTATGTYLVRNFKLANIWPPVLVLHENCFPFNNMYGQIAFIEIETIKFSFFVLWHIGYFDVPKCLIT